MVAFVKQFEAENPGFTVKRDVVPAATMESQELVEAAAGQLPDLLMMDNPGWADWLPPVTWSRSTSSVSIQAG